MGLIERWKALRAAGVLGINERNAGFVLPQNPRRYYPRVDNKLLTKQLAEQADIPVPPLLGVATYQHDIRLLPEILAPYSDFVLKPACGSQGNGILVIVGVENGFYRKSSGALVSLADLNRHVSSTLSGVFSLRGDADSCMIESRVILDPRFEDIARYGIPDIRVIVYRGIPVMAMCRLPTAASDGRANLHQGAIGAGLDIATGRVVHAAFHNRSITHHMDTGARIVGFHVPGWEQLLYLAARASDISSLGYLGVDVVVDATAGPVLLELNARPGLAIQIANREGLRPRLKQAESVPLSRLGSWEERCAVAREMFARPLA